MRKNEIPNLILMYLQVFAMRLLAKNRISWKKLKYELEKNFWLPQPLDIFPIEWNE